MWEYQKPFRLDRKRPGAIPTPLNTCLPLMKSSNMPTVKCKFNNDLGHRESIYQYKEGGKVLIELRNKKTRSRRKNRNNTAD